jgi:hypothetical protein
MNTIKANHLHNISEFTKEWKIKNFSIDYNQNIIFLLLKEIEESKNFAIGYFKEDKSIIVELKYDNKYANFEIAQSLNNKWLLIDKKPNSFQEDGVSAVDTDDSEESGFIFDFDGNFINKITLGYGIRDVQTTENDDIWVSYTDYGVYGFGIGVQGLICFDKNMKKTFEYNDKIKEKNGFEYIDDCYAMNVFSNSETYIYYYDDFPVVKISDKVITNVLYDIPLTGAKGLAIGQNKIVFDGSYKEIDKLFSLTLDTLQLQKLIIVDNDNKVIEYTETTCRHNKIYIQSGTDIYVIEI